MVARGACTDSISEPCIIPCHQSPSKEEERFPPRYLRAAGLALKVMEQCRRTINALFAFLAGLALDIALGEVNHGGLVLEQSCLVDELPVTLPGQGIEAQGRSMDSGGQVLL